MGSSSKPWHAIRLRNSLADKLIEFKLNAKSEVDAEAEAEVVFKAQAEAAEKAKAKAKK